jgi:hypothetical protein
MTHPAPSLRTGTPQPRLCLTERTPGMSQILNEVTEAERQARKAERRANNRRQNRQLAVLIPLTVCLMAGLGVKQGGYSFGELIDRPMIAFEWWDDELWKPPTIECRHGCWPKFIDNPNRPQQTGADS